MLLPLQGNKCLFFPHMRLVGKLHGIDFMSLEMSPVVENCFTAPTLNSLGSVDVGTSCSQ